MKEPEISKRWLAAGKALALDPTIMIPCPVCEKENLIVQDIAINNSNKFERILSCPNCGAGNILLLNKKAVA
jgi:hypothetical protein